MKLKKIIILTIFVVWLFFAFFQSKQILDDNIQYNENRKKWSTMDINIKDIFVKIEESDESISYLPTISYTYEITGKSYTGESNFDGQSSKEDAQKVINNSKYKKDMKVTISYDNSDPSKTIITELIENNNDVYKEQFYIQLIGISVISVIFLAVILLIVK